MIVTTLDKLTDYKELKWAQAVVDFIADFRKTDMAPGRYDIQGDDLFAAVSRYDTEPKEDRLFESHRKYIDLQILLDGSERLFWAPVESLEMTSEEFSKGGDIAFYKGESNTGVLLNGNVCAVLFENDAHMPNVIYTEKENVLKVVFKINAEKF